MRDFVKTTAGVGTPIEAGCNDYCTTSSVEFYRCKLGPVCAATRDSFGLGGSVQRGTALPPLILARILRN